MIVKICFTIKKPKGVSNIDFMEWINYNCNGIEQVSDSNKMKNKDMVELIENKNINYKILNKKQI